MPRQRREERAAGSEHALHADPSSLCLDEALREREAETRAGEPLRGARIELLKLDEQAVLVLGLDADAGVFHLDAEALALFRPGPDRDAPPSGVNLIAFER